jgi:hypothetical protein
LLPSSIIASNYARFNRSAFCYGVIILASTRSVMLVYFTGEKRLLSVILSEKKKVTGLRRLAVKRLGQRSHNTWRETQFKHYGILFVKH